VEGAELYVFRGALQLLKANRPVLIFEMKSSNWQEISTTLQDLGYVLYNSDLPPAERQPLTEARFNILALPA
jgi:hypothetical protein